MNWKGNGWTESKRIGRRKISVYRYRIFLRWSSVCVAMLVSVPALESLFRRSLADLPEEWKETEKNYRGKKKVNNKKMPSDSCKLRTQQSRFRSVQSKFDYIVAAHTLPFNLPTRSAFIATEHTDESVVHVHINSRSVSKCAFPHSDSAQPLSRRAPVCASVCGE